MALFLSKEADIVPNSGFCCPRNISDVKIGSMGVEGCVCVVGVKTQVQRASRFIGSLYPEQPPAPGPAHLPFRLSVEQSTGRMDVDHLLVNQCPVTLLRVFLGSVSKESTADGLLHSDGGLTTGDHIQLVSIRKINEEKTKM